MKKSVSSIAIVALTAITILALYTVPVIAGDGRSTIYTQSNTSPEIASSTKAYIPLLLNQVSFGAKPVMFYFTNSENRLIGENVYYSLWVENRGRAAAINVVISDTLSTYLDLSGVSTPKGTYTADLTTGNWSVRMPSLDAYEFVLIRVDGRVNATGVTTTASNVAKMTYTYIGQIFHITSNPAYLHIGPTLTPTASVTPTATRTATATPSPANYAPAATLPPPPPNQ